MELPSLTKQWHTQPYASIDPTRPDLAISSDKVIVITGGGGKIGRAIALALARGGATKLAVTGRRPAPLEATKLAVERAAPAAHVLVVTGDLADAGSTAAALATVAARWGRIDVLIANAAYLSAWQPVAVADPAEWWTGFETNVRGAFNLARAFVPHANPAGAAVVDVSSCIAQMPALPGASGYAASKLAATKVWEAVGAENPGIHVVHVQPGTIESDLNVKSGVIGSDSEDLAGHFIVWVLSPEARKFRGKFLWANWDVDELKSREEELTAPDQLSITMTGWPFAQ